MLCGSGMWDSGSWVKGWRMHQNSIAIGNLFILFSHDSQLELCLSIPHSSFWVFTRWGPVFFSTASRLFVCFFKAYFCQKNKDHLWVEVSTHFTHTFHWKEQKVLKWCPSYLFSSKGVIYPAEVKVVCRLGGSGWTPMKWLLHLDSSVSEVDSTLIIWNYPENVLQT